MITYPPSFRVVQAGHEFVPDAIKFGRFSRPAAGNLLAFSGYFVDTRGVRLPMGEVPSLSLFQAFPKGKSLLNEP